MENSPILRSLVAGGRPSGTGRSTSSPAPERSVEAHERTREAHEPFERHVERAREANRRDPSAQKSSRNEAAPAERERAEQTDAKERRAEVESQLDESAPLPQPIADAANPPVVAVDSDAQAVAPATPEFEASSNSTRATAKNTADGAAASPLPAPELAPETLLGSPLEAPAASSELVAFGGPPAAASTKPARGAANASAEQGANSTNSTAGDVAASELAIDAAAESGAEPVLATNAETAFAPAHNGADALNVNTRETALPATAPTDAGARPGDNASAAKSEAPAPSAPPPLDAERSAEVLRQVRLRLSPELRQAVIQLEPRELGRIAIRISVTRGVVRAELRAEQQTTLDALERHAPELKAALERVGLGAESFALQLGFDDASAHEGPAGELPRGSRQRSSELAASEQPLSSAQLRSVATRLAAAGGVDTYA